MDRKSLSFSPVLKNKTKHTRVGATIYLIIRGGGLIGIRVIAGPTPFGDNRCSLKWVHRAVEICRGHIHQYRLTQIIDHHETIVQAENQSIFLSKKKRIR